MFSGEYVSSNQRFKNIFIKFIVVVHLVAVEKKFDKCVFIGWSVAVFILLIKIFNCTFNLFINNVVRETIFDEGLFYGF